ncbi:hypothetical protein TNIN_302851 [Trichonephila inaurata madagascariensis]|uniref:Uncharacterized protein n=1 Tax=Trichonephila inaurata madagascariensis TaxID=2747483 RepID=A0A8X6Y4W6_9ARAC|nr:hypothetical protein TNIN_302851 [Trichonephila inaurata madagascariensis]
MSFPDSRMSLAWTSPSSFLKRQLIFIVNVFQGALYVTTTRRCCGVRPRATELLCPLCSGDPLYCVPVNGDDLPGFHPQKGCLLREKNSSNTCSSCIGYRDSFCILV